MAKKVALLVQRISFLEAGNSMSESMARNAVKTYICDTVAEIDPILFIFDQESK